MQVSFLRRWLVDFQSNASFQECSSSYPLGEAGGVMDFYCHKSALIIEVDGNIHDLQQDEDASREKALREMGLRVVRFKNDEIVQNLFVVVRKIREQLN